MLVQMFLSIPQRCRRLLRNRQPVGRMLVFGWVLAILLLSPAEGQVKKKAAPARERLAETYFLPIRREFRVGRATREALVFAPKSAATTPAPVVFAFHGHGGTMQTAVTIFEIHKAWEDAIVVYPQGLPTPTPGDPQGTKPGWVTTESDDNRDLRFFDAMLESLEKEYRVDRRRVFATGNSNGGFFTYTLWAQRPDVLTAVAPGAATLGRSEGMLQPKPVFCIGGERDDKVSIDKQRQTIEQLAKINGCSGLTRKGRHPLVTVHPSPGGTPVASFIHPGGHAFPKEAVRPMVEFFQRAGQPAPAERTGRTP